MLYKIGWFLVGHYDSDDEEISEVLEHSESFDEAQVQEMIRRALQISAEASLAIRPERLLYLGHLFCEYEDKRCVTSVLCREFGFRRVEPLEALVREDRMYSSSSGNELVSSWLGEELAERIAQHNEDICLANSLKRAERDLKNAEAEVARISKRKNKADE